MRLELMRLVVWTGFLTLLSSQSLFGQFESSHMELLAQIPNPTGASSTDIWGWTDDQTGIDYALVGSDFGVDIYDLSDPYQPGYVGRWLTNGFDVKVYRHYAYSVRDVLDLSVIRGVSTPQNFVSDATFSNGFHNVFVNEETGVLYGSCPSIVAYDLTNPLEPEWLDITGGACHDAMSTVYHGPDTRHVGKEILFGSQGNSLRIYDTEDKTNITLLSVNTYPQLSYVHQGWPSEDHRYFFVADELDTDVPGTRTHVFDIFDLEDPEYLGYYAGPTRATDHNLYVKGDLLYLANYAAGVRVIQLHDPATVDMTEIAYLDTFPQSDGGGYGLGAWTVYPFFESGILIASDVQRGLFVMKLDLGNDADFDDDGTIGCSDIDALVSLLASGSTNASYDLTNDGLVTAADMVAWQEMAGEALFGPGAAVLPGDANLDGTVDGQDFIAWYDHRFTANASWCNGDFDANGIVDGNDFIVWNNHKFSSSPLAIPVPEPATAISLMIAMAYLFPRLSSLQLAILRPLN